MISCSVNDVVITSEVVFTECPLSLIEGRIGNQLANSIYVNNATLGSCIAWPVVKRAFKAIVLLEEGSNVIHLQHGFYEKKIIAIFKVKPIIYKVQPVYIVCKHTDGTFQAPEGIDNSIESATRRISLGCALIQIFTSQSLRQHPDIGCASFSMRLNPLTNLPHCTVFYSRYTAKEIYSMSESEIWRNVAKEIFNSNFSEAQTTKYLAFLSCTHYDGMNYENTWKHKQILAATKGYAAIGGGGLAVLGLANLYTWPENLESIVPCFTDATLIDGTKFMDDSAYRHTYWASCSTGLGAVLHELGHTFDLAHTEYGIMSRADDMHKFFVLEGASPVKQPSNILTSKLQKLAQEIELQRNKNSRKANLCDLENGNNVVAAEFIPYFEITNNHSVDKSEKQTNTSGVVKAKISLPYSRLDRGLWTGNSLNEDPVGLKDLNVYRDHTRSESHWSLCSAVMLRFSRWLLPDCENLECFRKPYGNSESPSS